MRKECVKLFISFALLSAFPVKAGNVLSLNYSYGFFSDKKGLPGLSLQYMHAPESLGIIGSATFLKNNSSNGVDSKYASVLAGPVYKLNSAAYLFAMFGVSASSKMKDSQSNELYGPADLPPVLNTTFS